MRWVYTLWCWGEFEQADQKLPAASLPAVWPSPLQPSGWAGRIGAVRGSSGGPSPNTWQDEHCSPQPLTLGPPLSPNTIPANVRHFFFFFDKPCLRFIAQTPQEDPSPGAHQPFCPHIGRQRPLLCSLHRGLGTFGSRRLRLSLSWSLSVAASAAQGLVWALAFGQQSRRPMAMPARAHFPAWGEQRNQVD